MHGRREFTHGAQGVGNVAAEQVTLHLPNGGEIDALELIVDNDELLVHLPTREDEEEEHPTASAPANGARATDSAASSTTSTTTTTATATTTTTTTVTEKAGPAGATTRKPTVEAARPESPFDDPLSLSQLQQSPAAQKQIEKTVTIVEPPVSPLPHEEAPLATTATTTTETTIPTVDANADTVVGPDTDFESTRKPDSTAERDSRSVSFEKSTSLDRSGAEIHFTERSTAEAGAALRERAFSLRRLASMGDLRSLRSDPLAREAAAAGTLHYSSAHNSYTYSTMWLRRY